MSRQRTCCRDPAAPTPMPHGPAPMAMMSHGSCGSCSGFITPAFVLPGVLEAEAGSACLVRRLGGNDEVRLVGVRDDERPCPLVAPDLHAVDELPLLVFRRLHQPAHDRALAPPRAGDAFLLLVDRAVLAGELTEPPAVERECLE